MNLEEMEKKNAALEKRIQLAEEKQKSWESAQAAAIAAVGQQVPGSAGTQNSDEIRCLRYFGVGHVKHLLQINTCAPEYKHVPLELKFLVQNLKKSIDVARMVAQVVHGDQLDRGPVGGDNFNAAAVKSIGDSYYGKHVLAPKLKAFGTGVVGEGAEWVPTIVSSTFIEEFELERLVLEQFRQVPMPSSPFDVPIQNGVTQARRQVQSCDPADNLASNNFGTGKITLEAEKLVEFMCLPEELNEDSAPAILGLVRQEVTEAQLRAFENAILNGDTTGPHMDLDITGVVDARTAWKGLRKLALESAGAATHDHGDAAVILTGLRKMREQMGKFGVNESLLTWTVSPRVYNQMLSLPEVTTVEKFGPQATILRGALAALDGIPIIKSEFVRDDTNTTGVHTAVPAADIRSVCYLYNRSRFMWGVRRPIRVRAVTDPTPPGDRWLVASWWRGDFKGHAQSASEASVQLGYNIGV